MTLKEYTEKHPDVDLTQVKVRIPDDLITEAKLSGLKSFDVYLKSRWHFGVWVSLTPENGRVYPITGVTDILNWKVIDTITK